MPPLNIRGLDIFWSAHVKLIDILRRLEPAEGLWIGKDEGLAIIPLDGMRSGAGRCDGAERSKSGAETREGDAGVGGTATINAAREQHIAGV